jgi:hypothetical protein
MQIIGRAKMKLATGALFRTEGNDVVIRETQKFRNVTPHHHATVRRRQRGNEQAMVTPGDRTRDRAGCEAAESIGHEPLTGEEQLPRVVRFVPWQRSFGENHFASEFKSLKTMTKFGIVPDWEQELPKSPGFVVSR